MKALATGFLDSPRNEGDWIRRWLIVSDLSFVIHHSSFV